MVYYHLQRYIHFGEDYNDLFWRPQKPMVVFQLVEALVHGMIKRLD
jgi:hypothetical protein